MTLEVSGSKPVSLSTYWLNPVLSYLDRASVFPVLLPSSPQLMEYFWFLVLICLTNHQYVWMWIICLILFHTIHSSLTFLKLRLGLNPGTNLLLTRQLNCPQNKVSPPNKINKANNIL